MNARFALGLAALACGADAWALPPTAAIDIQFFMAGATAQKNTIPNVLGGAAAETVYGFSYPAVPAICVPGTLDFFYDPAQAGPPAVAAGSNYRAYSCTLAAVSSIPQALQGKNILIHYRLLSGSWIGVGPLSRGQAVTRMSVDSTCTATTTPVPTTFPIANIYNKASYTCPNTTTAVPDVGVSDQEPAIFVADNAPNDGVPRNATENPVTPADLASLNVAPLQAVLMNIIASKKLVNAMQTAQGKNVTAAGVAVADADRPNLDSPQVTGLLTNNGGAYNVDWQPVVGAAGANKTVHICRRISAVGTQIAANVFWSNYPCAPTSSAPPTGPVYPPNLASVANGGVYNNGTYTVTEANLIADLRACVAQYNNSTTAADNFAVGLLFTDNNPSTESYAWDYLSIDGTAPTVPNAVSGAYRFVTTETWQYRINAVNGAPALATNTNQFNLVTTLFGLLGAPASLAVQTGFMAVPDNGYTPGVSGNNVWSASTFGPNTCNNPIQFY